MVDLDIELGFIQLAHRSIHEVIAEFRIVGIWFWKETKHLLGNGINQIRRDLVASLRPYALISVIPGSETRGYGITASIALEEIPRPIRVGGSAIHVGVHKCTQRNCITKCVLGKVPSPHRVCGYQACKRNAVP